MTYLIQGNSKRIYRIYRKGNTSRVTLCSWIGFDCNCDHRDNRFVRAPPPQLQVLSRDSLLFAPTRTQTNATAAHRKLIFWPHIIEAFVQSEVLPICCVKICCVDLVNRAERHWLYRADDCSLDCSTCGVIVMRLCQRVFEGNPPLSYVYPARLA